MSPFARTATTGSASNRPLLWSRSTSSRISAAQCASVSPATTCKRVMHVVGLLSSGAASASLVAAANPNETNASPTRALLLAFILPPLRLFEARIALSFGRQHGIVGVRLGMSASGHCRLSATRVPSLVPSVASDSLVPIAGRRAMTDTRLSIAGLEEWIERTLREAGTPGAAVVLERRGEPAPRSGLWLPRR